MSTESEHPIVDRGPVAADGAAPLQTRPGHTDTPGLTRDDEVRRRDVALTFGMLLFLAGLTMLFAAGMVLYIIKRLQTNVAEFEVPFGLWISTGVIVVSGVTIWWANLSRKQGQAGAMKAGLLATLVLGLAFIAIQTPSLLAMLETEAEQALRDSAVYRIAVFLIILHALHVLGGMVALLLALYQGFSMKKRSLADFVWVRQAAMYWHYVDAIWMVMFALFILMG